MTEWDNQWIIQLPKKANSVFSDVEDILNDHCPQNDLNYSTRNRSYFPPNRPILHIWSLYFSPWIQIIMSDPESSTNGRVPTLVQLCQRGEQSCSPLPTSDL
jgi:hypothetical protein